MNTQKSEGEKEWGKYIIRANQKRQLTTRISARIPTALPGLSGDKRTDVRLPLARRGKRVPPISVACY